MLIFFSGIVAALVLNAFSNIGLNVNLVQHVSEEFIPSAFGTNVLAALVHSSTYSREPESV